VQNAIVCLIAGAAITVAVLFAIKKATVKA